MRPRAHPALLPLLILLASCSSQQPSVEQEPTANPQQALPSRHRLLQAPQPCPSRTWSGAS